MIRADARRKLSPQDMEFISTTIARTESESTAVLKLLTDQEDRDQLLDSPALFARLTQTYPPTNVSLLLYFYVLLRRSLREFSIDNRDVADYLASMLAEFSRGNRSEMIAEGQQKQFRYLFDLLNALLEASSDDAFLIQSHIGNYSMFLTGIFPDYIYHRARYGRAAPDFSYYERMGSTGYHSAARSRAAERLQVAHILELLGTQFKQIRLALNFMVDSYMKLDDSAGGTEKVFRRIQNFIESRRPPGS